MGVLSMENGSSVGGSILSFPCQDWRAKRSSREVLAGVQRIMTQEAKLARAQCIFDVLSYGAWMPGQRIMTGHDPGSELARRPRRRGAAHARCMTRMTGATCADARACVGVGA